METTDTDTQILIAPDSSQRAGKYIEMAHSNTPLPGHGGGASDGDLYGVSRKCNIGCYFNFDGECIREGHECW